MLGENLRGQVWIENQIHIRLWPDWESNPGRIGERHGNNRCANPPAKQTPHTAQMINIYYSTHAKAICANTMWKLLLCNNRSVSMTWYHILSFLIYLTFRLKRAKIWFFLPKITFEHCLVKISRNTRLDTNYKPESAL